MNDMKAVIYEGTRQVATREVPLPKGKEGWSLIKVDFCGVCGTDLNIFAGSHPRAKEALIIGHEFAGTVVEHPDLPAGTAVTVRPLLFCGTCEPCQDGNSHVCESLGLLGIDRPGGMAEYVLAPADEVYPLPPGMSMKRGALIEPFAVAVHAVRESAFKPGDAVTVFGAGPIGLCVAVTLKLFGATDVAVVEVQPFRKEIAAALGFTVIDPSQPDAVIPQRPVVYDCAAHPSVAKQLVQVTAIKGQIVLVGTYKYPTELDLQNITFKELSVKGTRVYTRKDYEIAAALLSSDFEFERMITHEYPADQAAEAFELLAAGGDSVKVLITL
ncbi:zinc-dependent alcohol dehydrogenase [Ectobacillus ponti]|uniref:Alcohol dehydrogenase catalytic domain-containing protein n=1 Tax=Ectobacillus ponti TaxID=2961894 RepID=A0AA42BQR8_9BACI|nr:alcohol dehydrogenase catalytic domain-containing protein [Ectobacillus ponti]MCP8969671.1 alcohol dehydrogenase catalytic domain-containing protein [Ectobacillus ponti]